MLQLRLLLAAVVAAFVAAPAIAGPFNFLGGDAYSEASATGGPLVSQLRTFTAADLTGSSFATSAGESAFGQSFFQHSASSNQLSITGTSQASRTGNASAYGFTANDPSGTYGYVLDFQVTQATNATLNVNFQAQQSGQSSYSDIYAYLWNPTTDELWDFGLVNQNGAQTHSGGNLIGATFPYPLFLNTGTYQLYIQSQSFVDGTTGSSSSLANMGIILQATAAIPEPMSVMMFGGLVAVGGWVTRRRMKATA